MKTLPLLALTLSLASGNVLASSAEPVAGDWRKSATDEEKMAQLIEVMRGASNLMIEMGERYKNLYWAAKQGKWAFAEYQREEMQDLVETLTITRPGRATTAQVFLDEGFQALDAALPSRDWGRFNAAFEAMRGQCMSCHRANDHAFIELPQVPPMGSSPILDH